MSSLMLASIGEKERDMAEDGELITLTEAARRFGRSRLWWGQQTEKTDGLRSYTVPGKRGKFLKVSEIEAYLQPRARDEEPHQ